MRAADIARVMKKVSGEGTAVAKLFAKHIKVEAQVKQLQRSHTGVGVGTPARLLQLIEIGALSLDHLERIVVDASHIDQKKMGIMGIKDTMLALAKLLSRADLRMRYGQAKRRVTLLFY
jgi:protein CMS1